MSPRKSHIVVSVVGMDGTFQQVARGQRRTRVKQENSNESFLVDNSLIMRISVPNSVVKCLDEAAKGIRRGVHNGVEVVIIRKNRVQTRVALPGSKVSYLADSEEILGQYDFVSAISSESADLVSPEGGEVFFEIIT